MIKTEPMATFRLLKDFHPGDVASPRLSDLREQLAAVPDFGNVTLSPEGASTVVATMPAMNQRRKDQLKSLLEKTIRGWTVIGDGTYHLPTTF